MIIALVGPSGSGKSAVSKSLECFYEVLKTPSKAEKIYKRYDKVIVDTVKQLVEMDGFMNKPRGMKKIVSWFKTHYRSKKFTVKEVVSHTTRQQRDGEKNGIHYHFVNVEEFLKLTKYDETLYCGNYYGLTKQAVDGVLNESEIAIVVVDRVGVENIKKFTKDIKSLFLKTNPETMEEHMMIRGDSQEVIKKRLDNAMKNNELEYAEADFTVENVGELVETMKQVIPIIESFRYKKAS